MTIDENRIQQIFDNMIGKRIAVIGDVMLDRYLWGNATRISPESPVPVIALEREEARIGGAANVADNINVLGAKPLLIAVIGDDESGKRLLKRAKELDLDVSSVVIDSSRPTTEKTRIVARNQHICRLDREITTEINEKAYEDVLGKFHELLPTLDGVIISDYGKGVISSRLVGEIVDNCCSHGLFVATDPKESHWEYYNGVNLIKPNNHEAERATGIETSSEKGLEKAGWKLLDKTGAGSAIITTGERGMSIFEHGRAVRHLPTMAREVYDVTGAGDTVIATATTSIIAGATLEEAAIIANHAAGIVVAEVGTAVAKPEQIFESMGVEKCKD